MRRNRYCLCDDLVSSPKTSLYFSFNAGTENRRNSSILRTKAVRGEYCDEPFTIEGEVEGSIDVTGHLLTIAPRGNVRASVRASEIDVLGSLQGNVEAAQKIYVRNGRASSETFTRVAL
jgi:cytoskeletal protein CcmA (bactofilin family)